MLQAFMSTPRFLSTLVHEQDNGEITLTHCHSDGLTLLWLRRRQQAIQHRHANAHFCLLGGKTPGAKLSTSEEMHDKIIGGYLTINHYHSICVTTCFRYGTFIRCASEGLLLRYFHFPGPSYQSLILLRCFFCYVDGNGFLSVRAGLKKDKVGSMAKVSLEKNKIKFLLVEGIHQKALDSLHAAGYTNIEYHKGALDNEQLKASVRDAHFIGLRSRTHLTEEIFAAAEKLVAVGCFCIGTNQVDLQAAERRGIPVFNAPFSNTRSVAELVIGELLLLLRGVPQANAKVHRGEWNKQAAGSYEARGKKLGIVGYGHIGTQLGILAESLGMQVYFYDIENKLPLGNATQMPRLSDLLSVSDVVSLHVPENATTKNMIGAPELALMKAGALLINAARGTVVDISALCDALARKHLAGAAIDVFPTEPASNNEPFFSPLCGFDNVLLTPHIGGSTQEAQENIGLEVAGKLIKYSDNGSTLSAVNFPQVSLPLHGGRRLLHIHENRPGVMTAINQVFANLGVNIAGQYLQTTPLMGYVVIDIEADAAMAQRALLNLKAVAGTIRSRLLY